MVRCLLLTVIAVCLTGSAIAADVCEGTPKEGWVTRLDGPTAVIPGTVEDLDDLRDLVEQENEAFAAVLRERGLQGVAGNLMHILAAGMVEETDLKKGDTLQWMTTRRKGKVTAFGPVCMAADTVYEAFEVKVLEEGATVDTLHHFLVPKVCGNLALVSSTPVPKPPPIPPPVVMLSADRDCTTGTVTVDGTGSSEGLRITMKTADGAEKQVAPGTLEDPAPFTSPLTFKAVAENTSREGATQRTEKTVTVNSCPALPPECALQTDFDDVWTGQEFVVSADGHWKQDGLALRIVDRKGVEIERFVPAPSMPYTTSIGKPGFYRVQGGATNEVGETWGCECMVYVRPRWKARVKAVNISPTDRTNHYTLAPDDNLIQGFDTNIGGGLEIEYMASRRLGVELGATLGSVESDMQRRLQGMVEKSRDTHSLTIFSAALNIHLTRQPGVDFYLGPLVALVDLGDGSYRLFGDDFDFEGGSDLGFGAQIGIDTPLGRTSAWSFHLSARFIDADFDANDDIGSVRLDPFVAGLGFAYGF